MSRRLTADAGGTSTDWLFEDSSTGERQLVTTRGFNAAVQAPQELAQIVAELPPEFLQTDRMAFFGAGCRGQFETATGALLSGLFPKAEIETGSDLLGAARALFADRHGIACILGTGSASGLYDGHRICVSTPSLGYIVGDEGSGAVLGRIFLERAFKGQLPAAICAEVTSMLSVDELITRVYRTPGANTWLAGFTRVIARHISCPPGGPVPVCCMQTGSTISSTRPRPMTLARSSPCGRKAAGRSRRKTGTEAAEQRTT